MHASRLKFYADHSFEVTEEVREHVAAQGIILEVRALVAHRYNHESQEFEFLVSWKGLESIEDSWEPLVRLWHDVKVLVSSYVDSSGDDALAEALNALRMS